MDSDLRASLIASGAAAILSILVGVIAGVGFLTLALRAVLGGLVFGGVVYGGFFLMRRYLPELFGPAERDEAEPGEAGSTVNIVLQGEGAEDYAVGEGEPRRPARMGAGGREGIDGGLGRDGEEGEAGEIGDPPRRRSPSLQKPVVEEEDYSYSSESLLEDEVQPAGAAGAAPAQPRAAEFRSSVGIDDIDVLPDLESLSDGFAPMSHDGGDESIHSYSEAEPRAREGGGSGKTDPAVLAQAVRTLLKRDQER